tara:strand:- start:612 stop:2207 length:1596 start_codon:yes stop_codon:yes gene_type:complete
MSDVLEQQVEEHMNSSTLPGMKIVSAAPPEDTSPGGEDVRDVVEKESGVRRAFPPTEEEAVVEEPPAEEPPAEEPEGEEAKSETETKEDLPDAVDNFMDRLGFNKPKKEKASEEEPPAEAEPEAEAEEEPQVEAEAEETEEEAEAEVEEEPAKAKRKRRKKEGIDADEIKEIIRETAQSVSRQSQPYEEAQATQPPAESLIESKNRADLDVFYEMEADPKYAGIRDKYLTYVTKLSEYKAAWNKENPSAKFNLEDMEHEDFITGNQPEYDVGDFNDAKITVKARSLMEERDRSYRQEIEELRSSVEEGNMKEELQTASNASIAEVVKIADESYLKVVQDGGGDALKDADPIAHDVLNEVLGQHEKALYELEKLAHPTKKFRVNSKNETHKALLNFAAKKEADITKMPVSEQMHEGRRFATAKQWASMPSNQRSNHWTLQPEHIKAMYISDIGQQAKEKIDSQREVFDKYVKHKTGQKSSPKETAVANKTQKRRAKTNPPSTSGEAVNATGGNQATTVDVGDRSHLKKRLWG